MIEWISSWASAIIVAVIIATIIEMILPEGSCKKYIKVVIGVYILFTIISPVITKFTGKTVSVSDIIDIDTYIDEIKEKQISQNMLQESNSASIRDIYIGNLKADIKQKVRQKGYIVTDVKLNVGNDDNYTINEIYLEVLKEDSANTGNDYNEDTISETENVKVVDEININISGVNDSFNGNISSSNEAIRNNTNEESKGKLNTNMDNKSFNISNNEKKKLKEYISNVYEVREANIHIN